MYIRVGLLDSHVMNVGACGSVDESQFGSDEPMKARHLDSMKMTLNIHDMQNGGHAIVVHL